MGQWRGPLFHLTTAQPFSEVLFTNWQVTREQHHWSMMCSRIGFYRSGRIPGSGQIVHSSLPQVLVKWVKVPQLQNACLGHINTHIINVCQYLEGPFNRTEGEKAYNTILVSMVASLKAQSFFAGVMWETFLLHQAEALSSRDMTRCTIRGPVSQKYYQAAFIPFVWHPSRWG